MKRNMGVVDRAVRILVALVVLWLVFAGKVGGALAIVLGIIAVVFLVTSLVGHCPAYGPLKISTHKGPPDSSSV